MDAVAAMKARLDDIRHERLVRHAACVGITETVAGFELMPMNLVHWTRLRIMRSPYLPPFRTPDHGDTIAFLWMLSPEYVAGNSAEARAARKKFFLQRFDFVPRLPSWYAFTLSARARQLLHEAECLKRHAVIVHQLREYVADTMLDAPAGETTTGIPAPEYYCDAVAICCRLAREFGGGLQHYPRLPLKLLFQAMKEAREHSYLEAGKTPVMFNRSDAHDDADLERINRESIRAGVKFHPDALRHRQRMQEQN